MDARNTDAPGRAAARGGTNAMLFLGVLAAVSLAALAFVPPIPQDPLYHAFADRRTLVGVPHFWNVVSNLPFLAVGALGALSGHTFKRLAAAAACYAAYRYFSVREPLGRSSRP